MSIRRTCGLQTFDLQPIRVNISNIIIINNYENFLSFSFFIGLLESKKQILSKMLKRFAVYYFQITDDPMCKLQSSN